MTINGGDIWEGNTITDIQKVISFYKFMYLRTWGGNTKIGKEKDILFDLNWKNLKGKLPRGTYFEFQPSLTPQQNIERFKNVYPSNDPSEIPDLIVYEIEPPTNKSKQQNIEEACIEYDEIKKFLGCNPIVYTGKWYWDAEFGSMRLSSEANFIISSYYWSNKYARARKINSYEDLIQFIPPTWSGGVLGDTDKPLGIQWTGDQFVVPGITGYMDSIILNMSLQDFVNMRNLQVVVKPDPDPISTPAIEIPAYIELSKNNHALNVPFISQLGQGADKYHNDCGAACVSMLVSGYTQQNVSVDEIYARIQPNADTYLSISQLKNALSWYGIDSTSVDNLSKEYYWNSMINKTPSIALINYKPIVDAKLADTNITFTGFHFVVVVGLDADGVLIHDPLFHKEDGGFRHIPFEVYDKAIRTEGAGILITVNKPLGFQPTPIFTKYLVTVSERYVRSGPGTNYSYVSSKYKGDIISIESVSGSWGKVSGTSNWVYMVGLQKV